MAMVKAKAQYIGVPLSQDIIQYIAASVTENVRELEGVVRKIAALHSLMNRELTLELAQEAVRDIFKEKPGLHPTPALILEEVSAFYNLPADRIRSNSRSREVVLPRQVTEYLIREMTDLSLPDIGSFMYIATTSSRGLHHLVYEIVDNAIDEALAGYCTHIEVTILPGDVICVCDNGRGIPTGPHPKLGISTLEVVYTVLHAGGKFGGGGYKVAGGLHGVGASVVNALSEWMRVKVWNEGETHEIAFARGITTEKMRVTGKTDRTGTEVTFKPDPEIFDELVYDYETLQTRLREQAFLNAGIRITLTDKRPGQERQDSMPSAKRMTWSI